MEIEQVRGEAFAMPLTNPAFPPGPYRFINREFMIITYRTDRKALERVVPKRMARRGSASWCATIWRTSI